MTREHDEHAAASKSKRSALGWIAIVIAVFVFLGVVTFTSITATRDANEARDISEHERAARVADNARAIRIACERSNEQAEAFRSYLDRNTGTSITPEVIAGIQDPELRNLLEGLRARSTQTAGEARSLRSKLVLYDCTVIPPVPIPDPPAPG